jgi:hypothetical protein
LTLSDNQKSGPRKMLAEPQTQEDHALATGRRFHTLTAAVFLIQIVAQHSVHDRLYKALEVLGQAPGCTVHADTALQAARQGLRLLALALLHASVKRERG